MRRRQSLLRDAFLILLGIFGVVLLNTSAQPEYGQVRYWFSEGKIYTAQNPFFVQPEGPLLHVAVPIFVPNKRAMNMYIHPDDCVETLVVNDVNVPDSIAKFCDYSERGPMVDLSNYMKMGNNTLVFTIRDVGGLTGLRITPARSLLHTVLSGALLALAILWIGAFLYKKYFMRKIHFHLYAILLMGVFLRVAYWLSTPYTLRGHDTQAHIDYIRYIAVHVLIPEASKGWEFHQAPLYYIISGLWMKTLFFMGIAYPTALKHIHLFSLLISIATLVIALWTTNILFPKKDQTAERALLFSGFAVMPSLIFLSARITNNGLYHLVAFWLIGFLLQWWRDGKLEQWYRVCYLAGISIITKVSGLLFLPIIVVLMLFNKHYAYSKKWKYGFLGLAIVILCVWWLPVIRFVYEHDVQNSITFGSQRMHPGLFVGNAIENFTVFNPSEILRIPFNSPWSDLYRRQYFWEYFFRSAFFGEFQYKNSQAIIAVGLLLTALALIPLWCIGFIKTTMKDFWKNVPMLLLLLFGLAAHLSYRFIAPFSSNQDFRFSIILLLPFLYYTICCIRFLPKSAQPYAKACIVALYVYSGVFLITLSLP